jgi:hypothetical protein
MRRCGPLHRGQLQAYQNDSRKHVKWPQQRGRNGTPRILGMAGAAFPTNADAARAARAPPMPKRREFLIG